MDYVTEAMTILRQVTEMARRGGKLTGFCIGNTRKVDSAGLFFSPIRVTSKLVAGSVIVYAVEEAIRLTSALDGRVDYILVDTEKKISTEMYGTQDVGNIERAIRENAKESAVLTYKANDLTVDCIDAVLAQLVGDPIRGISGKRIAVLGAGNLGCKLALKLVERGAQVTLTRRDGKALDVIVRALNLIKPPETIAMIRGTIDNEAAAKGADVLIGLTAGCAVITQNMINDLPASAVVVDGGKGSLFPGALRRAEERGIPVLRVDIRPGFEGQVAMLLEIERIVKHTMGRKEIEGVGIVSGGLLARADEVVVDNIHNPSIIFGLANGLGDFVRTPSPEQTEKLAIVRKMIHG